MKKLALVFVLAVALMVPVSAFAETHSNGTIVQYSFPEW